ncbi:hypothetical protein K1T71_006936 [Dendrolimus kikuchii]|uniref:Uncharacterized protein n=1 Tax=Dendrolimus kikuchii TaxID=765133 RepID=A0ACC1CZA5_9NEOP|nr:hypothetical protein K1T71_006936 [Dendrolimus kikuchii]
MAESTNKADKIGTGVAVKGHSETENSVADFIVIGGGTAGCVVANRLSEDPNITVLLIEAGGIPPKESLMPALLLYNKNNRTNWDIETQGDGYTFSGYKNKNYDLIQGKMLGGCSSLNLMNYFPIAPIDFNYWAKLVNNSVWSWDSVNKNYLIKKIENMQSKKVLNSANRKYYGTKGLLKLTVASFKKIKKYLDGFKEVGKNIIDVFTPNNFVAYGPPTQTLANDYRQSSAYAYLSPIRKRKNLHVLINTEAIEILFDGSRAIGVKVVNKGKKYTLRAKKGIIVAAGAINSPKLLMLSGIGPKEHLKSFGINVKINLRVGYNLQDHVSVTLYHKTGVKVSKSLEQHDAIESILGTSSVNESTKNPEYLSLIHVQSRETALKYCAYFEGVENKICDSIFAECDNNEIISSQLAPLHPISRGRVKLRSSNYKDSPVVVPKYYDNDKELSNHVKYLKDYLKVFDSESFKKLGVKFLKPKLLKCDMFVNDSDDYWKCFILSLTTSFRHYCGTCAMGSVVDNRLKVYGTQNLYVADTSMFPIINSGGPAGVAMMVGEVAADIIKEDYGIRN